MKHDQSSDNPNVSWFPGHMYKAQKRLASEVRHADMVLEVRDARLPVSSGNEELRKLLGSKPHLLVFNKSALATNEGVTAWKAHFERREYENLWIDAESGKGLNEVLSKSKSLLSGKHSNLAKRGIRPPPPRLMVVGMPNVGKSTLINRLLRKNRLKTAPTPGETRSVTWVHLKQDMLLMDSPGMMLPRLSRETEALPLGWIGCIRDSIIGQLRLAESLLDRLRASSTAEVPADFEAKFKSCENSRELIALYGRGRGFLKGGNDVDLNQSSDALLRDFRLGKLGKVMLEMPRK